MSGEDFQIFRLAGPMTAFGSIAVGERRSLWDAPSGSTAEGRCCATTTPPSPRSEELACDDQPYTVISERLYNIQACATVTLWRLVSGLAPLLTELAQALCHPAHILYLGRKRCPLGQLPWPQVISAATRTAALHVYDRAWRKAEALSHLPHLSPPDPDEDAPEATVTAQPREEASGDDGHRG